jgi:hypothetical protein
MVAASSWRIAIEDYADSKRGDNASRIRNLEMCLSTPSISCAAVLLLCVPRVYAQSGEIERITESIRSAPDVLTVRQRMAELVEIDSAAAATAFANELVRIEADLDRESEETLVPYLMLIFDFTDTTDIRQSLVPTFERILDGEVLDSERLYLTAALAKFGAQEKVQWLIDQYRQSNSLGLTARAFELLCRTNQDQAVRFVVEEAVQSFDPTVKLSTERCLREMGNPASLELMRRWIGVGSDDVGQSIVGQYLESIILFGDSSDLEFLEWLDANASGIYGPDESRVAPVIETARASIDERTGTRLPLR